MSRRPTEQEREADHNFRYYDDGEPEPKAAEAKCSCWFNQRGDLILRARDCPEHGETPSR